MLWVAHHFSGLWGDFRVIICIVSMNKTDKPASFGCDAKSVAVQKNGKNWIIKWQYDSRLEGPK